MSTVDLAPITRYGLCRLLVDRNVALGGAVVVAPVQVTLFADVPLATSGPIVLKAALNILRSMAQVIDSADMPDGQATPNATHLW